MYTGSEARFFPFSFIIRALASLSLLPRKLSFRDSEDAKDARELDLDEERLRAIPPPPPLLLMPRL